MDRARELSKNFWGDSLTHISIPLSLQHLLPATTLNFLSTFGFPSAEAIHKVTKRIYPFDPEKMRRIEFQNLTYMAFNYSEPETIAIQSPIGEIWMLYDPYDNKTPAPHPTLFVNSDIERYLYFSTMYLNLRQELFTLEKQYLELNMTGKERDKLDEEREHKVDMTKEAFKGMDAPTIGQDTQETWWSFQLFDLIAYY